MERLFSYAAGLRSRPGKQIPAAYNCLMLSVTWLLTPERAALVKWYIAFVTDCRPAERHGNWFVKANC